MPSNEIKSRRACSIRRRLASSRAGSSGTSAIWEACPASMSGLTNAVWMQDKISSALWMTALLRDSSEWSTASFRPNIPNREFPRCFSSSSSIELACNLTLFRWDLPASLKDRIQELACRVKRQLYGHGFAHDSTQGYLISLCKYSHDSCFLATSFGIMYKIGFQNLKSHWWVT